MTPVHCSHLADKIADLEIAVGMPEWIDTLPVVVTSAVNQTSVLAHGRFISISRYAGSS